MKHKKDRVIALDYFRGICILSILLSHSYMFSGPLSYFSGRSSPWASAAELFFLISGVTLGIVRGDAIVTDFKNVVRKSWKRAKDLYLIHITVVLVSLGVAACLIGLGTDNTVLGLSPNSSGLAFISHIFGLEYNFGWAPYLRFYAIFMVIAPLALRVLWTRYWAAVPLLSIAVYIFSTPTYFHLLDFGHYWEFTIWQLYFFLGLTISRFRRPILQKFFSLNKTITKRISTFLIAAAATAMVISIMLGFDQTFFPVVARLTQDGWIPLKAQNAYIHLLHHKAFFELWMNNNRQGVLRPLAVLLYFGGGYLFYQRYKGFLLRYTGRFVNTMGRNTLWIYVAQAVLVPIMASLPIPHQNLVTNFSMAGLLVGLMWLLTQRQRILSRSLAYFNELSTSFSQAKYATMYSNNDSLD